jgi:hypothetical protein
MLRPISGRAYWDRALCGRFAASVSPRHIAEYQIQGQLTNAQARISKDCNTSVQQFRLECCKNGEQRIHVVTSD